MSVRFHNSVIQNINMSRLNCIRITNDPATRIFGLKQSTMRLQLLHSRSMIRNAALLCKQFSNSNSKLNEDRDREFVVRTTIVHLRRSLSSWPIVQSDLLLFIYVKQIKIGLFKKPESSKRIQIVQFIIIRLKQNSRIYYIFRNKLSETPSAWN